MNPGLLCYKSSWWSGWELNPGLPCNKSSWWSGWELNPGLPCNKSSWWSDSGRELNPGLPCYKSIQWSGRELKLGITVVQIQPVVRAGINPGTLDSKSRIHASYALNTALHRFYPFTIKWVTDAFKLFFSFSRCPPSFRGPRCRQLSCTKTQIQCNDKCVEIRNICSKSVTCPLRPSRITALCGSKFKFQLLETCHLLSGVGGGRADATFIPDKVLYPPPPCMTQTNYLFFFFFF